MSGGGSGLPLIIMATKSKWLTGWGIACLWLLASYPLCGSGQINLTGSWTLSTSSADLSDGAGSDFITPQDSADNQVLINVVAPFGGYGSWNVRVYKIDSNWDPALTLTVIRTGNGTGSGTITGGTDPGVVVPTGAASAAAFFNGSRSRSAIPVLLRIEGLTADLGPPSSYTTTVYYSLN